VFANFLILGCSAGRYGHLRNSPEVARAFETYHVFPDHRYYYLNQENNPFGLVALQQHYTLSGVEWQHFDPEPQKLKKLVDLVKGFPAYYSYAYGSYIEDPQGNRIGYWYSSLWMRGIRIDPQTQTVSIDTEKPWLRDEEYRPGVGVGIGSGGSRIRIGF